MSPQPRSLLALLALLAAGAVDAHAGILAEENFDIRIGELDDNENFDQWSSTQTAEFFNKAACQCDATFAVDVRLKGVTAVLPSYPVEVWVGTSCEVTSGVMNLETRDGRCVQLLNATIADVNLLRTDVIRFEVSAADFIAPNDLLCGPVEADHFLYFLIEEDGDIQNGYESIGKWKAFVDTIGPPEVVSPEAFGAENGATVEWTLPGQNIDDLRSFQVLCMRADTMQPAFENPPDADFVTIESLIEDGYCEQLRARRSPPTWTAPVISHGVDVDAGMAMEPDAGVDDPDAGAPSVPHPQALLDGDPSLVCSEETGSTGTSLRVRGLENGASYWIAVASIDPRRNATITPVGTAPVTPEPVTDFWEDYKDQGGAAQGGFCFVATAAYGNYDHPFVRILRDFRDGTLAKTSWGRAFIAWYYDNSPALAGFIERHPVARVVAGLLLMPLVTLAAIWEYTGPLGKLALLALLWLALRARVRRRLLVPAARRALAAGGALLALLWAGSASAQPYWDEPGGPADEAAHLPDPVSHWTFELKFGPYFPDVDSEFMSSGDRPPPYEMMFGDDSAVMTVFELDRYFLFPAGQLGLAFSVGYAADSARAFQVDPATGEIEVDEEGNFKRAPGDETKFRLLPTSVGVVYRFTALDDRYGIPVIPYAKAGLSYYVWWVRRPDGGLAFVQDDPTCIEDCEGDKARGATLGYQATAGLLVRMERIDKNAGRALRTEMGIEHAGFFIEGVMAKVDGLGQSNRLRVGDTTWFAGINFEF